MKICQLFSLYVSWNYFFSRKTRTETLISLFYIGAFCRYLINAYNLCQKLSPKIVFLKFLPRKQMKSLTKLELDFSSKIILELHFISNERFNPQMNKINTFTISEKRQWTSFPSSLSPGSYAPIYSVTRFNLANSFILTF